MPDITLDPTLAGTLASSLIGALNGGTVLFYSGTQPSDPSASAGAAQLLGTLTLANPCGTHVGGVITFAAITADTAADAGGIATWTRWRNASAVAQVDMAVGDMSSSKPVRMATTTVVSGAPISITTATFTVG